MNNPVKTILLLFAVAVFWGLLNIAPRVANDVYSIFVPPAPSNPFSGEQTIYSNIVPQSSDIINLDNSGTLTPSPANGLYFTVSATGACSAVGGNPLPYSQGIVLILNVPTILSDHDPNNPSKPARFMEFIASSTPASSYLSFTPGTMHEVRTGGRTFDVTLSHINDLSTAKNGPYFSYTFNIIELGYAPGFESDKKKLDTL